MGDFQDTSRQQLVAAKECLLLVNRLRPWDCPAPCPGRGELTAPRNVGSSWRSRAMCSVVVALVLGSVGCAPWGAAAQTAPAVAVLPNPLPVSAGDEEYLWNQIVDTVDDYFKIEREVRMRNDGGVVTDGLVQTYPVIGSSYLEPWRGDSMPGFEKLHASLQSIRRRAVVRVIPLAGGYSIELAVYKELEDVAQPEFATVGASTLRHDGSLVRNESNPVNGPATLGWIPPARDVGLEQRTLAEWRVRVEG